MFRKQAFRKQTVREPAWRCFRRVRSQSAAGTRPAGLLCPSRTARAPESTLRRGPRCEFARPEAFLLKRSKRLAFPSRRAGTRESQGAVYRRARSNADPARETDRNDPRGRFGLFRSASSGRLGSIRWFLPLLWWRAIANALKNSRTILTDAARTDEVA